MDQISAHSKLGDEELLAAYRSSGDDRLLGLLLQRYTMLLLGVAMKYMKNRTDAEDAVQQVFLKAITHLPAGEIQNFKGWLYVLMRNHCLQLLRDKHYKAAEQTLDNVSATETDKEALLLQEHTLEQLLESLQELGNEQRICIIMFYMQKRSYNEIMAATGFTFTQVKSYIQNGKRNLKILLLKKTGKDK